MLWRLHQSVAGSATTTTTWCVCVCVLFWFCHRERGSWAGSFFLRRSTLPSAMVRRSSWFNHTSSTTSFPEDRIVNFFGTSTAGAPAPSSLVSPILPFPVCFGIQSWRSNPPSPNPSPLSTFSYFLRISNRANFSHTSIATGFDGAGVALSTQACHALKSPTKSDEVLLLKTRMHREYLRLACLVASK